MFPSPFRAAVAGAATLAVCSLTLVAMPASSGTAAAAPVEVTATDGWQDTGVTVTDGQSVTISATGSWSVDQTNVPYVGPEGYTPEQDADIYQGCKLDADLPYARLLGRIGDGPLFPVGASKTLTADRDGEVSLRIHDDDACLVDNDGSVSANVDATATPDPSTCKSVAVVGVRGSGQTAKDTRGFGPEVGATVEQATADLLAADHTVGTWAVDYTAADVTVLKPARWEVQALLGGVAAVAAELIYYTTAHLRPWAASIGGGVQTTSRFLLRQAATCKQQQFVLVGYSQGASVVHRTLQRLADSDKDPILARVHGVGLIADPDKVSKSDAAAHGTAGTESVGVRAALRVGVTDLPDSVVGRTVNLCDKHDLVCDFSVDAAIHWRRGIAEHTGYGAKQLEKLGSTLADQVPGP